MGREREIRQAAVEHEWAIVFDDVFAEGAEWADNNPAESTIKRVIELYKMWYSEQLDVNYVEYIKENWQRSEPKPARK